MIGEFDQEPVPSTFPGVCRGHLGRKTPVLYQIKTFLILLSDLLHLCVMMNNIIVEQTCSRQKTARVVKFLTALKRSCTHACTEITTAESANAINYNLYYSNPIVIVR